MTVRFVPLIPAGWKRRAAVPRLRRLFIRLLVATRHDAIGERMRVVAERLVGYGARVPEARIARLALNCCAVVGQRVIEIAGGAVGVAALRLGCAGDIKCQSSNVRSSGLDRIERDFPHFCGYGRAGGRPW